jgi:AcrR family transcriptional regulator
MVGGFSQRFASPARGAGMPRGPGVRSSDTQARERSGSRRCRSGRSSVAAAPLALAPPDRRTDRRRAVGRARFAPGLNRYRTIAYSGSHRFHQTVCLSCYTRLTKDAMVDVTTRNYQQRRRAEAAEETRRRILDAVYEQLRGAPAQPINIDQIANTAEVARSTVYVVFGSRQGLFDSLGEDLLKRAGFERMLRQSRQPDARKNLRAVIHELATMYTAERDVIRALVSMAQLDPGAFSGAIKRLEERRAHGMTELARRLADQNQLRRGLDPRAAADALWLLTSFDAFDLLHTGRRLSTPRVADTLIEIIEHAVCLTTSDAPNA